MANYSFVSQGEIQAWREWARKQSVKTLATNLVEETTETSIVPSPLPQRRQGGCSSCSRRRY